MANKYSGLSDFEVNKLIASMIYTSPNNYILPYNGEDDVIISYLGRPIFNVNYCEHYDAFKLMIDNKFVLNFNSRMNKWAATFLSNDTVIMSCNENPCRAIAECFLIMKDAEKE